MTHKIARELKQKSPFASAEQEVFLGLRIASARLLQPWARLLKAEARLSSTQYNVLRILRGSHPGKLSSSEVGSRMVDSDPDITRLVDRLSRRGLVKRSASREDRRVVEVGITDKGLELLGSLDQHAERMPKALLGHLGMARLRQLRELLESVISKADTYP